MPGNRVKIRGNSWRRFKQHGEFCYASGATSSNCSSNQLQRPSFAIDPIDPQKNNYLETFRDDLHVPLVQAHYHRDVIDAEADFAPYRLLVLQRLPMLEFIGEESPAGLGRGGGTVILGPMTGTCSEEMTA